MLPLARTSATHKYTRESRPLQLDTPDETKSQ